MHGSALYEGKGAGSKEKRLARKIFGVDRQGGRSYSQESGVRSQESGVRSQESGVRI